MIGPGYIVSSIDHKIMVWPSAFTHEECDRIIQRFPWSLGQTILHLPDVAREAGAQCAERMPRVPKLQWGDEITLGCTDRPWHVDEKIGDATHKLCIYLDRTNVGTEFRHPFGLWKGPWRGSVALFEIDLEHRTAITPPAQSDLRRVLGLRARMNTDASRPV